MEAITVRTTQNKFIISFDKNSIDKETFERFLEQFKLNLISKDAVKANFLEKKIEAEKNQKSKLFLAAQRFRGSAANSEHVYTKYDVYEQ